MSVDFNKNKIQANGTDVVSTPSPSPTEHPSAAKQIVDMEGLYYNPEQVEQSEKNTEKAQQDAQQTRENRAVANKNAVEEVSMTKEASMAMAMRKEQDVIDGDNAGESGKTEEYENAEAQNRTADVKEPAQTHFEKEEVLADKNKTIYQKTSILLDEYIKNHPDEYPQYANMSETAKSKFRDQILGDVYKILTGKDLKNRTPEEHKIATRDLATLLAKGVSVKDIQNKKIDIRAEIKQGEKDLFNYMLNKVDTSNPDKALNAIAEIYLTFTDNDYLTKDSHEKAIYMKTKQNDLLKMLGIDPSEKVEFSPEAKQTSASILKNLLSKLSEKGLTLKDFKDASAKDQNDLLIKALDDLIDNNKDKFKQLPEEIQKGYKILETRNDLIKLTRKDNPTDRELLEKLKEIEANGTLTPEQEELLDFYTVADKIGKRNKKDILGEPAKIIPSATIESFITGKSHYKRYLDKFKGVHPGSTEANKLLNVEFEKIKNEPQNAAILTTSLVKALKEVGYTKEQIQEIFKNMSSEDREMLTTFGHANSNAENVSDFSTNVAEFGTSDMIEQTQQISEDLSSVRSAEFMETYTTNIGTTIFDNSITRGINNNFDIETANKIFSNAAKYRTTEEGRSSVVKFSLLTTSDSERIKTFVESYKQIQDSAVTEGMAAAAHNTTDAKNKAIINSGVDYAIKNNGYSADEVKNINTARETGQTSYERNASSTDSTNSSSKTSQSTTTNPVNNNSSSTSKTSTASSSGGSAQTKPSASSASSTKVNISPANSNTVSQLRTQLAQIQYEHSIALRDKALDGLQHIIDKIQNDQQVRAQKQAELAAKEAKTDAEISQAIKEAETKSAQEQKKAEEQVAKETLAQIEEQEQLEKKYNISIEKINKLKSAARNGDLTTIYTELGTISADAQKHFVQYLSRKDTATIIGFIRNRSSDKSLIRELCRLNPGLIKSLDSSLLMSCGIEKAEIIKYSDSRQLATLLADLSKVGNREELRLFYNALGSNADQVIEQANIPGTREWENKMRDNMRTASASMASNVVSSTKFPEGQTRQKIRRQDYPDYREFLA